MKLILSLLLTPIFYINFGILLGIFHILQICSYKLGGEKAHEKIIQGLCWCMMTNMKMTGSRIKTTGEDLLPKNRPLIIVSNHQTLMDIFAVVWTFKDHHPRFAAKIELAKGIPSVSYFLRIGKSALIDRNNPRQAIGELLKAGKSINNTNHSICIFAEGSRNKDGKMAPFQSAGIATLIKSSPNALIVPFAINGHAQFQNKHLLSIGQKISYNVLQPIEPQGRNTEELVCEIESIIRTKLNQ